MKTTQQHATKRPSCVYSDLYEEAMERYRGTVEFRLLGEQPEVR